MPDRGQCRACPAQMIWVEMVDDAGVPKLKDGKPVRNPLDVEPFGQDRSEEILADVELLNRTHAVIYSPVTGHGMMLTAATLQDARRWFAQGQVSLHLSHFATCPSRAQFARSDG